MQMKHLIILALIGIVILLGFNIINGNRHEKNRAVALGNATPIHTTAMAMPNDKLSNSANIASQPLGKQPKAIMDNATSQINQAQQVEQERLDQVINTQ